MALLLFPSSFECDCGHQSHFCERTVRELGAMSRRKARTVRLGDGGVNAHTIEFEDGEAKTIVCPELGRCPITGSA